MTNSNDIQWASRFNHQGYTSFSVSQSVCRKVDSSWLVMFVRVRRGPIPGVARRHLPTRVTWWTGHWFSRFPRPCFTGKLSTPKKTPQKTDQTIRLSEAIEGMVRTWTEQLTFSTTNENRIADYNKNIPTQKFSRKCGVIILVSFLLRGRSCLSFFSFYSGLN